MKPKETIRAFDQFLTSHRETFSAIAIGGTALAILGVISRETRDCDILDPEIPETIQKLARKFAVEQTRSGKVLGEDWLNNGPSSLIKNLPEAWRTRLAPLFTGKALKLSTLGRSDLLKTKLFALCDRGTDRQDCLALKPSAEEITECIEWVKYQDANPGWPKHVEEVLKSLAKELGHGI
jgi:Nucleotidyltransferase of unknown function (DUF6036)